MSEFPDLRQPSAFDPTIKVGQTTPNLPTDPQPVRETAKIAELQAQLAALTWTEITPKNLPRVGDEVLCFDEEGSIVYEVTSMHVLFSAQKWRDERGMTHRRPINPPLPSAAKGETKP